MTAEQVVFILAAIVTLGSALGMVTTRSVFVGALWMVAVFGGVAALFILLGAGFLGIVQILVYIGAIAVLILFAIMLTPRVMGDPQAPRYNRQWPLVAVMASALASLLVALVLRTDWPVAQEGTPTIAGFAVELGKGFMTTYILPFEVASVLLLVALIGAIVIAREE
ncbi:MAG: NADH-quinone oxidoreductase subunit J [Ardenticatenia bacterium]|nr:NADH-quinone oxidoreductase subunit J [Ardenticatenia bacterium]